MFGATRNDIISSANNTAVIVTQAMAVADRPILGLAINLRSAFITCGVD